MIRVLFLGGLGRSGTTLLERILGELPGVCALGEVVHLWQRDLRDDERCGCGVPFSACSFWQQVGDRAFGGWSAVDVDRVLALRAACDRTRHLPSVAAGGRRSVVEEYAGYYAKIYRAAAEVSGASILVDSSKHASLAYCLRRHPDIDLRVVHVVRDSRGVAYSWTKRVARPESAADGQPADEMTRYTPTRSALLWDAHNLAFAALARLGTRVRRLRYEELVADPVRTTLSLAAFAGTDASAAVDFLGSAGTVQLSRCHSAAGNPMRFTVGPVPLRRDDAWRAALTRRHRAVVSTLTAPLLTWYGYRLLRGR